MSKMSTGSAKPATRYPAASSMEFFTWQTPLFKKFFLLTIGYLEYILLLEEQWRH
jgi:hypothetical protein